MNYVIERIGNRIVRCGFGDTRPVAGGIVVEVDSYVDLPAYWDGEKAVSIKAPTPNHNFDYEALEWKPDMNRAWWEVRRDRDAKLTKTDFRVIRSMEDGKPMTKEWKDYRQALRDVTQQSDPFNIVWPAEPE